MMLPYSGLRVLDITRVLASPYATYLLALLGADVVKVEDPRSGGDTSRNRVGDDPRLASLGMASNFISLNANKRSVTIDMRTPEGQQQLRRLAVEADVLVENFRPGVMDGYGLGYEALKALNPRLVYCSVTGYGSTGPRAAHPAYDPVIQASSGMMAITGTAETGPMKSGAPVVDYGAGLAAAFAISAALRQRDATGEGQFIDVSMFETSLALMGNAVTENLTSGSEPRAWGNGFGHFIPANRCFETADGLLWIAASEAHRLRALWATLGREDIPADPRFGTPADRRTNWIALQQEMQTTLMTATAQQWEDRLNAANVPAMRVRTVGEAVRHPQLADRPFLQTITDIPGVGQATVPTLPFIMSAATARIDLRPPLLGEHNDELLGDSGWQARTRPPHAS